MPSNPDIAERITSILSEWENLEAKKMFGSVGYLMHGNMLCGVYKDYLILRLGENVSKEALEMASVKPFDITGKPMKGWVMMEGEGFKTDDELRGFLNMAKVFAKTLPAK